jgi:hypothetical protein
MAQARSRKPPVLLNIEADRVWSKRVENAFDPTQGSLIHLRAVKSGILYLRQLQGDAFPNSMVISRRWFQRYL